MPRWKIQAVDADSGQECELVVDQPSRDEAIRFAMARTKGTKIVSVDLDQPAPSERPGRGAAPSSDGSSRAERDTPARGSPASEARRSPEPPGAVHCPQCDGWRWKSRWPGATILLAVLLFPIGLLGLLISERRHTCRTCGYRYSSKTDPPVWTGDPILDADSRPSEEALARADRAARLLRRFFWTAFFLTAIAAAWYFLIHPLQ